MARLVPAAAMAFLLLAVTGAHALPADPRGQRNAVPAGTIEGRVLDEKQTPVVGAMVSVVGTTTAVATTALDGRFVLNELPFGPYILSVHSRGYWQAPGRTIQLTTRKFSVPEIRLIAVSTATQPPAGPASTQLAGFGLDLPVIRDPAPSPASAVPPPAEQGEEAETAWRLRHLPRSILKNVAAEGMPAEHARDFEPPNWFGRTRGAITPVAFLAELPPLSGQVNLMTIDSFDRPAELFSGNSARSVAYLSVNTEAAGGAWAVQGAMTQGDLSSWIVAGSYTSMASTAHAYELGLTYSTQRYDGGNAAALAAIPDNARNVGRVYGFDEWTASPRVVIGYGTAYARYDYLQGAGVWSPRLSLTLPVNGFRVRALASQRAIVPGAEEFAPSVTGLWLPPERTFSSLAAGAAFTPEQTRHLQVSLERDLAAGISVSVRGFGQHVSDQLVEVFGVDFPGRPETPLGHYFVGTAGDIDARGWGVGMVREVPGHLRGTLEYTVTTAHWLPSSNPSFTRSAAFASTENIHDLQSSIEATIPQTATRIYAKYRVNTAFWNADVDDLLRASSSSRFNVRVSQSLPFLRFSSADWEMLVDVRNMFRDADGEASPYDEAFAVRAPKRIVGGILVKF